MKSVDIPEKTAVNFCTGYVCVTTYMIDSDKFSLVLKYHALILSISADFGIFPVVNRYFRGFGTIVARYVEDATSGYKFLSTSSLLADACGVVNIGIT
jgi:hypothetical protein